MLDYRLNTFLTLSRVLNYTKTAEILHITQPAVSQHIKFLEEEYGVKLFNYQGKSLSLTKEGESLYSFALSMKTSSDKIKSLISLPRDENIPLRFGTTLTVGEYTMKNILENLLKDYPKIHLTMNVGNTETLLNQLREGQIDFAILEGHFDKSDYFSKFFSLENFIGVSSPDHDFSNRQVSFNELFKERLILREKGSGTRNIFEQILYEHNYTMKSFKQVVEVGNMGIIKTLVENNMGISFLYEEAVKKELAQGRLKRINLSSFNIEREFNFVFLKNSLHEEEYLNWYDYFIDKL